MSEESNAAEVPEGEAPVPETSGRNRLVILLVVGVLVVGGLGAGAWLLLPRVLGGGKPAAPVVVTVKATVPLGSVVVNLNGQDRRYLRVGVSLGVPDAKQVKELEEHRSQLLDLLISVFSAAEVDQLTSEDGKAQIKQVLVARMREELRLESVARVYFTEFVIQ